ncbi:glycoside hydrolase family 75 protein [Sphingobium sp. EM0848]|uniref:glycoside hydrolase family 75 protein n=1 Tax=Sphingobium sp. EM0848 TaxID=2743473 RepID=UPI00159BFA14|nr:glycoside hydrolase family 75 protein [Sphingobium sp. EM0848]
MNIYRWDTVLVTVTATLLLAGTPLQATECPLKTGFTFNETVKVKSKAGITKKAHPVSVQMGPASSLVYTNKLRVNTDGSPRSYNQYGRDAPGAVQAYNRLCNALSVKLKSGEILSAETQPNCHFITQYYQPTRDSGWKISPEYTIKWYAIEHEDPKDGRYRPCVQQSGPFKNFFISTTALPNVLNQKSCNVANWVDSDQIPYITLPPDGRFDQGGKAMGSLALVRATIAGQRRTVVAIVADTGNSFELGEGSIALHRLLRGMTPDSFAPYQSYEIGSAVTTILFPELKAERPFTNEGLQAQREHLEALLGDADTAENCLTARP